MRASRRRKTTSGRVKKFAETMELAAYWMQKKMSGTAKENEMAALGLQVLAWRSSVIFFSFVCRRWSSVAGGDCNNMRVLQVVEFVTSWN